MKYGFIGAGQVSVALAKRLIAAGHEVVLSGRRGPAHLATTVASLGAAARAADVAEAAGADVVFLAVPWTEVANALDGLPAWNARVLVDITNPFVADGAGYALADLQGASSSVLVAGYAPGARVVKAFNSMLMTNFERGAEEGGVKRVLFVSGDDAQAKQWVRDLIVVFGYAVIDLGGLEEGGRLQQGGGALAGQDLLLFSSWRLDA